MRSTIGAGELGFQVSEQGGKVHFYILERMQEVIFSVFGMRTGVPIQELYTLSPFSSKMLGKVLRKCLGTFSPSQSKPGNKKTLKVGAYLLSLLRSTIGGSGLDFRVRNENG